MKKIYLLFIILSSLSCYDGLTGMLDDLNIKVPICVNSVTGNDADNGRGWANAKQTLQAAVNAADAGDEIWIAGAQTVSSVILLTQPVSIYGGFNGTESRLTERSTASRAVITGSVSTQQISIKSSNVIIDSVNFQACANGSAITADTALSVVIKNCDFTSNTSSAIRTSNSTVEISGCRFINNKITNNSGGAISSSAGQIIITSSYFENNNTNNGGGAIFTNNAGTLNISDTDFIKNNANSGGAISLGPDSSLYITGGVFNENFASGTGAMGGAICSSGKSVIITGTAFIKNNTYEHGGAIYAYNAESFTVTGCYFGSTGKEKPSDTVNKNYTVAGAGGAIYVINCTVTSITGSWFYNNSAANGGGIYINNGNTEIWNSTINQNIASANGGGIYLHCSATTTFKIINSRILNNDAGEGTAFYKGSHSTEHLYIYNSLFADLPGETASLYYMNTTSTMTYIYNSTFISHDNLGQYDGSGGSFASYNCIFYGNQITTLYAPAFSYTGTSIAGNTEIDKDANKKTMGQSSFTDYPGEDYTLSSGSICINAGNNTYAPSIVANDLAGNPRVSGGTVDIGCYEYR